MRFPPALHAVCNLLTGVPLGPQTFNPGRSRPERGGAHTIPVIFSKAGMSAALRISHTHLVLAKQKLYFLITRNSCKGGKAHAGSQGNMASVFPRGRNWTDVGRPASLQVVVIEEVLKVCRAEESRGEHSHSLLLMMMMPTF